MADSLLAIEIKTEDLMPLVNWSVEEGSELKFEDIRGYFLVFGYLDIKEGQEEPIISAKTLIPPDAIADYFDHVENLRTVMVKSMIVRQEGITSE